MNRPPPGRATKDTDSCYFLGLGMASSWINFTSSASNGVPSFLKISWNQTAGSRSTYGCCHESHGRNVCDLPATKPQLIAPTFVFFANDAAAVHFSYRRYLENRLRDAFGFDGTPMRLVFRDRSAIKLPRRRRAGGRTAARSRR